MTSPMQTRPRSSPACVTSPASGLSAARHLRGDVYEVRVDGENQAFRVLFAPEGRFKQVLLALEGFSKKTQKTPPQAIQLAEKRLSDWRERGKRKQ
jgi:phage-related protein